MITPTQFSSLWVITLGDDIYAGLTWASQQSAAPSQSECAHGAEGWKNGLQASPLQPLNTWDVGAATPSSIFLLGILLTQSPEAYATLASLSRSVFLLLGAH